MHHSSLNDGHNHYLVNILFEAFGEYQLFSVPGVPPKLRYQAVINIKDQGSSYSSSSSGFSFGFVFGCFVSAADVMPLKKNWCNTKDFSSHLRNY